MTAWKQFQLKNGMLSAVVAANLISGLSMDMLFLQGGAPLPTDILKLATFLDLTLIPIAYLITIAFILWYERPVRRYIGLAANRKPIPGHLARQARRHLLNEPFLLIIVSGSLWLYGTLLYSGLFWASGAGAFETHRTLYRSLGTGLITVVLAFFLLESILQKWLAPVFFPEGGLSRTPRVLRLRLDVRLGALLLACNVVPLMTILGATLRIIESTPDPARQVSLLRTAVILDATVFMAVGLALTWIVSRNLSQSMQAIIGALKRIHRRDLSGRVRVSTNDEIGYAGDIINEMAEGLKERNQMRQSLALAREVQQQLLPPTAITTPDGLQIAGRSIYCDETGGDYFDAFPIDAGGSRKMAVAVGDVSGHGIPSALLMATVRGALRQRAILAGSPGQIITDVNRQVARDVEESGQFVTLFFAVFDPAERSLQWVRAGHDPALLYDPRGDTFAILKGDGVALGITGKWSYGTHTTAAWEPGRVILIGTDGVWEARNRQGDMFGRKTLQRLIRQYARCDACRIRDEILSAVQDFQAGTRPEDDITLMVVKIDRPKP